MQRPRGNSGGVLRRATVAGGSLVVLPYLGLEISRRTGLDDRSARLFAVQALSPVIYLPVYAALIVGLVLRSVVLIALCTAVAVSQAAFVGPGLRSSPGDTELVGPVFELAAMNVAATNNAVAEVGQSLPDVDVLVITELTPQLAAVMQQDVTRARFPHRVEDARDGFFGSGIYSALPLQQPRRIEVGGLPAVRADLVTDAESFRLVAVHTIQPLADHWRLRQQLAELRDQARTSTGPLVVAGDFNANHHHRAFRRLLDTRLRDAHVDRGRVLARTWPANLLLPPIALLDHVLVSDELSVQHVSELHIPGSDHRGVRVRLQLRSPEGDEAG